MGTSCLRRVVVLLTLGAATGSIGCHELAPWWRSAALPTLSSVPDAEELTDIKFDFGMHFNVAQRRSIRSHESGGSSQYRIDESNADSCTLVLSVASRNDSVVLAPGWTTDSIWATSGARSWVTVPRNLQPRRVDSLNRSRRPLALVTWPRSAFLPGIGHRGGLAFFAKVHDGSGRVYRASGQFGPPR